MLTAKLKLLGELPIHSETVASAELSEWALWREWIAPNFITGPGAYPVGSANRIGAQIFFYSAPSFMCVKIHHHKS